MNYPEKLFYTKDPEWIFFMGETAIIGITYFAQGKLGDIISLNITNLNETLEYEKIFGTVDAVKTASDLFMPVTGKVIEVNQKIIDKPELINKDPYREGWIVKINVPDEKERINLLSANEYRKLIGA